MVEARDNAQAACDTAEAALSEALSKQEAVVEELTEAQAIAASTQQSTATASAAAKAYAAIDTDSVLVDGLTSTDGLDEDFVAYVATQRAAHAAALEELASAEEALAQAKASLAPTQAAYQAALETYNEKLSQLASIRAIYIDTVTPAVNQTGAEGLEESAASEAASAPTQTEAAVSVDVSSAARADTLASEAPVAQAIVLEVNAPSGAGSLPRTGETASGLSLALGLAGAAFAGAFALRRREEVLAHPADGHKQE